MINCSVAEFFLSSNQENQANQGSDNKINKGRIAMRPYNFLPELLYQYPRSVAIALTRLLNSLPHLSAPEKWTPGTLPPVRCRIISIISIADCPVDGEHDNSRCRADFFLESGDGVHTVGVHHAADVDISLFVDCPSLGNPEITGDRAERGRCAYRDP